MKEILVPVDFSPLTQPALRLATALAQACQARVNVVHVVEPQALLSLTLTGPMGVPGPVEEAQRHMATLARDYHHVAGAWIVTYGAVVGTILDMARRNAIDCIVMGTHDPRWLKTSHTLEVMRQAPCPVLTLNALLISPEEVYAHERN